MAHSLPDPHCRIGHVRLKKTGEELTILPPRPADDSNSVPVLVYLMDQERRVESFRVSPERPE